MSEIPENLKYTKSHEWIDIDGNIATIGITDHAQSELTDIVFVDLPPIDDEFQAESETAVVESVKTASDIYTPFDGTICEVNQELSDNPALINTSPYEDGWIFKIKLTNPADSENPELLDYEKYKSLIS